MKIVYLARSFAAKGGLERIFTEKMNYLAEKPDYEVYALTYEQGAHPFAYPFSPQVKHMDLNCRFFTLKRYSILKQIYLYAKLFFHYKYLFRQKIKEIQPDIVICTTLFFGDIYLLAHLPKDIITIVESHLAKSAVEHSQKSMGPIKWLYQIYDQYVFHHLKRCSILVTLTQADAKAWASVKESIVIPNFISYYPETIENRASNKNIISVGRLDIEQKGYDLLIQAWKKVYLSHPNWKVHIYGSGGDRDKLLNLIQQQQLETSFFIHEATHDIYSKYIESSFYVMSSRYEGFGLVLAEAMSCGLPCISFNCPYGPGEIIRHGEDGLLIPEENIEILADKICYLIEQEEIRSAMGQKARENVKRYLPDQIIPQWEKLFQDLYNKQITLSQH